MPKAGKSSTKSARPQRTQQERRDATSAAVLQSAIKLFGKNGYQKTSLEDVAADCGTTIRPIYHYYKNKKNLFLAAAETLESDLLAVFEGLEDGQSETLPVSAYWQAFTDECRKEGFRQVVLLDAPNVLGRDRWLNSPIVNKAIDYFYALYPGLGEKSRMLVSRVFVAALTEAALVLSEYEGRDEPPSFKELMGVFESLIGGKR